MTRGAGGGGRRLLSPSSWRDYMYFQLSDRLTDRRRTVSASMAYVALRDSSGRPDRRGKGRIGACHLGRPLEIGRPRRIQVRGT